MKLKYQLKHLITFLLIFVAGSYAFGSVQERVGIDERLGAQIPLELSFIDSRGDSVSLGEIIDKPTLLTLVYYSCPSICNPLLSEFGKTIEAVDLDPGEEFQVISLSFDHTESTNMAREWKENHLAAMRRPFPSSAWRFLTGDSININKLTESVGFYFKKDKKGNFIHSANVISLTPEGKVSRYLFGSNFQPFDLKMAVLEASEGKAVPTVNRVLQFCFSYDPEGQGYIFNVTKVAGSVILLASAIFLTFLLIKGKLKKSNERV